MSECEKKGFTTLANGDLPPHVRHVLGLVLDFSHKQLTPLLEVMLAGLDGELSSAAEATRDTFEQSRYLKAINLLKHRRDSYIPNYFCVLSEQLAQLRQGPAQAPNTLAMTAGSLALDWGLDTQTHTYHEDHRELARKAETSANLSIYLLGQRFGVLAAAPAFTVENLPIAPRGLLQVAHEVALTVFGETFPVAVLEKTFARFVLNAYPTYVDALNKLLEDAGVLRGLNYVPVRPARAKPHRRESGHASEASDTSTADKPLTSSEATPNIEPPSLPPAGLAARQMQEGALTPDAWMAQAESVPQAPAGNVVDFCLLQQLLTARRFAASPGAPPANTARPPAQPAQVLQPAQLTKLIDTLRPAPISDEQPTPSMAELQHRLLEQLRLEHGTGRHLRREDNDAIELLGLLLDAVAKEIRSNSPVHRLIGRMQWPLLRTVVEDRQFFEEEAHPARQILNTISESDARNEEDPHIDAAFEAAMQRAVGKLEKEYRGERELLDEVNSELQRQVAQQIERARSSEKRVIEAARGRERMSMAKRMAAEALEARLAGRQLPRAILLLLRSAWLDALTLALLRYGDNSHAWGTYLERTDAIIKLQTSNEARAYTDLAKEIESALERVGYHDQESANIARQLSRSPAMAPGEDEPTATEIAASIKARPRFGGDEPDEQKKPDTLAERSPREEECYRLLRTLPFGTWMDFVINQQGEVARRRLAWYSTLTDHTLFVNRRGQRIAEMYLDELARSMSRDQLRITEQNKMHLVDRAFSATASMLQKLLRSNAKTHSEPMPQ